jgi:hypothetical protein
MSIIVMLMLSVSNTAHLTEESYHLDAPFLIEVYLVLNTALPFWKLFSFQSLLGISETFLCPMSAL